MIVAVDNNAVVRFIPIGRSWTGRSTMKFHGEDDEGGMEGSHADAFVLFEKEGEKVR